MTGQVLSLLNKEMELKVNVEGIDRSVSGITEHTTCAQIIYALAHATSQKGRFVMIEKFRNNERRLSPNDKPLELLQKWKEHSQSVNWVLRRIVDEDTVSLSSTRPTTQRVDKQQSGLPGFLANRNISNSSVMSAQPFPSSTLTHPNRSTASLPPYTSSTLPRRPPPPDYNTVMEKKMASLSRGASSRPPLQMATPENVAPVSTLGLSHSELMSLIDRQRTAIEKSVDVMKSDDPNSDLYAEVVQIERQQDNLRSILEPLREQNWPQQYQNEVKRSHKLRASIEATREAMDKCKSDLKKMENDEDKLLNEINELDTTEEASDDLDHTFNVHNGSPKLRRTSAY